MLFHLDVFRGPVLMFCSWFRLRSFDCTSVAYTLDLRETVSLPRFFACTVLYMMYAVCMSMGAPSAMPHSVRIEGSIQVMVPNTMWSCLIGVINNYDCASLHLAENRNVGRSLLSIMQRLPLTYQCVRH